MLDRRCRSKLFHGNKKNLNIRRMFPRNVQIVAKSEDDMFLPDYID